MRHAIAVAVLVLGATQAQQPKPEAEPTPDVATVRAGLRSKKAIEVIWSAHHARTLGDRALAGPLQDTLHAWVKSQDDTAPIARLFVLDALHGLEAKMPASDLLPLLDDATAGTVAFALLAREPRHNQRELLQLFRDGWQLLCDPLQDEDSEAPIDDQRRLRTLERFRDQPLAGFCSGFLVDPSLVATAAHCVDEANLASIRFVFGFQMRNATTAETTVSTSEIYRGIRIIGRAIGNQGTDWAVVQLDRPVLNHRHVRLRRSGKVADNASVYVIGHPVGLPKKWAGGAVVRDNTPARYFVANLDTYGGNSGSAVFNAGTHDVEGILVRGETDFVMNGSCRVSNVVPVNGGRGEDCTRVSEFRSLVPRNQHDFIRFNHASAKAIQAGGRWKIQVDNMWLLDFGSSKTEAQRALKIIKHYKMNTQCFVGRPGPSMEFYLVNGQAPSGAMAGEDAISFNPANLQARHVSGRWKVVDGSHWLLDFDQSEQEARQALSYILRYGFRFLCFVGRPGPSMTYFRK